MVPSQHLRLGRFQAEFIWRWLPGHWEWMTAEIQTLAIHRCRFQMFASKFKALSPHPCGTHASSQCTSHEPLPCSSCCWSNISSQGSKHTSAANTRILCCLGTSDASVWDATRTCWALSSVQSLSRVHLFVTPWTAACQASPVHHQLLEFTQTHVRWVGDAIQPSHPLSSPFLPAFNLSQHQSFFQWVSSLHQMTKVLELQL